MPRMIDPGPPGAPIEIDEAVEMLATSGFDPADHASWDVAAPILSRLSANRRFLGAIAADALAGRDTGGARYGPQVVLLDPGRGRWFLRANMWPGADDPLLRASGRRAFFYDFPHDHDFSFLTIGHHGPGYVSDCWTYDPDGVAGLPGEPVTLHFDGRRQLGPGQVMLYRAHRDVHDQKPPARFSVTLNLMEAGAAVPGRSQYRFDPAAGAIVAPLGASAIEALMPLALHLGGGDGRDLVGDFARRHPADRIRFGAVRALAGAAASEDDRRTILAEAAGRGDRYVAPLAARALAEAGPIAAWASGTDA